jgi:FMN phosphatase YigB (HAD superfamily)
MKTAGVPIQAVLFDLDDTLLYNDMENVFLPRYFAMLTDYARPDIEPSRLMAALRAGSEAMNGPHPGQTNEQAFAAAFAPPLGKPWAELRTFFNRFYEERFPELRAYTKAHLAAQDVVQACFDAGYAVAIATNPLFPARAIEHRLAWAGLGDMSFDLVTTYENMHTCKPAPDYYVEIAERLNVLPASCWMVGNDVMRDIAPAQQAGMRTFLVDKWITNDDPQIEPDYRGRLTDLHTQLECPAS